MVLGLPDSMSIEPSDFDIPVKDYAFQDISNVSSLIDQMKLDGRILGGGSLGSVGGYEDGQEEFREWMQQFGMTLRVRS